MNISSMYLKNFRCFKNFYVDFNSQITVFVGGNGSGKTSILDAIAIFLGQILSIYEKNKRSVIANTDVSIGAKEVEIKFVNSFAGKKYNFGLCFQKDNTSFVADLNIPETQRLLRSVRSTDIPPFVYYGAQRSLADLAECGTETSEGDSKRKSISSQVDFSATAAWFIAKSSEEALEAVRRKDLNYRLPELEAVRKAVVRALGDYNEPYVSETPSKLFMTKKDAPQIPLRLEQLSAGYRTMMALIMDLARRLTLAHAQCSSPFCANVLEMPGIVLLDEVEMHLHPSWQQTVLPSLLEIFPHVQFFVTTHSPQVLSSLEAQHIRILGPDSAVYLAPQGTWGAESSRLLRQIFGVDNRPPSRARDELNEYANLVYTDCGKSSRALELRRILNARYGQQEPKLVELDLHMANREWEMADEVEGMRP